MPKEKMISLRLPEELLKCADALVPELGRQGNLAMVRVTRSTVLRIALSRGLDQLKAESEEFKKPRKK